MPRTLKALNSLHELLDASSRPIYAIDARRRIVYCNPALAAWLELEPKRVVGRVVEYHSETAGGLDAHRDPEAPLTDLCPPPRALAGEACDGTISCVARGGRLSHRHAVFVPLPVVKRANAETGGVLTILAEHELSPQDLADESSTDPSADELHRTIRRFRRELSAKFSVESLLGPSSAMQKVRSQVAAAAASGANTLIIGRPGSGRTHIARAIHYRAGGESPPRLVTIDGEVATEDSLRRAFDMLRAAGDDARHRPTLVVENLDRLELGHQSLVATAMRGAPARARVIATCANTSAPDRALVDALSTITIHLPRLTERPDDLPVLAQFFLEAANRGSEKQIGSIRPDTLDQLALYSWPGELDELRDTIAAAHAAATSHEISAADLPHVVHHARQSAARTPKRHERIVLDDLLAQIEREAITRALAAADGNKTEAADLLGLTRPRLYRRMVQLGLASESTESDSAMPEFIEEPSDDNRQ